MDAFGIVDPTSISDRSGAGMAISQGDALGAALSLVSVFPYIGDALGKSAKAVRLESLQLVEREAKASREAWERTRTADMARVRMAQIHPAAENRGGAQAERRRVAIRGQGRLRGQADERATSPAHFS